jgi:hypothetical protein
MANLPPLSLSILGVEPLDEFIREIADFVHYTIANRPPDLQGKVEVEAKVGLLRNRDTNQRLDLPILVESSECAVFALFSASSGSLTTRRLASRYTG